MSPIKRKKEMERKRGERMRDGETETEGGKGKGKKILKGTYKGRNREIKERDGKK